MTAIGEDIFVLVRWLFLVVSPRKAQSVEPTSFGRLYNGLYTRREVDMYSSVDSRCYDCHVRGRRTWKALLRCI